jgi:hypothetical protein
VLSSTEGNEDVSAWVKSLRSCSEGFGTRLRWALDRCAFVEAFLGRTNLALDFFAPFFFAGFDFDFFVPLVCFPFFLVFALVLLTICSSI